MSIDAMAKLAAQSIIDDLTDRRGLRQEWEEIDEQTQEEIKATWAKLIAQAFK